MKTSGSQRRAAALSMLFALILFAAAAPRSLRAQTLDAVERDVRRQVGAATAPQGDPNPQPAVQPGYLGVVADDRKDAGRGLRILEVLKGSPAEKGGLSANDLITSINGVVMRNLDDMAQTMAPLTAGRKVDFQVQRSGISLLQTVVLGQRPARADARFQRFGRQPANPLAAAAPGFGGPPAASTGPLLGVRTVPLDIEHRRTFKISAGQTGAYITAVTPGSPADRVGLSEGMLITEFDGQAVDGPDRLRPLVRAAGDGREVMIAFQNQNGELHRQVVRLTSPDAASPAGPAALPGEVPPGASFVLSNPTAPINNGPTGNGPNGNGPTGNGPNGNGPNGNGPNGNGPDGAAPPHPKIAELEAKIAELEARIRQLEAAAEAKP